jgi:hypothetical protein
VSLPSPEPVAPEVVERSALNPPPPPPVIAPPITAAYHPPPPYPPPAAGRGAPADGRAITSLASSILGIVLGLPFGVPGLALGPLAYFMGKSAIARIDSAPGTTGGRGMAVAGRVLGVVATAIGALVSLFWLILLLMVISAQPTFQ